MWTNSGEDIAMSGTVVLEKLTGVAVYGDEEFPVGIDGKVAFNDKAVKSDKLLLTVDGQTAQLNGDLDFKDKDNIQGRGLLTADLLKIKMKKFENFLYLLESLITRHR